MARKGDRPIWLGEDRRKFDHVRIHFSVIHDPRISPVHFAVYGALVAHAEIETGAAHPTLELVASYFAGCEDCLITSGMTSRTVRKALRDLEAWAYIATDEQPGKASSYRVLPPPTPETGSGVPRKLTTLTPETDDTDPGNRRQRNKEELEPRTRTKNERELLPSAMPRKSTHGVTRDPSPTEKIVNNLIDKTRTHVGKTGDPARGVYQSAWELTWERCAADEEADPFQGATMVLAAYFEDITGRAPNGQFGQFRLLVNQFGSFAFGGFADAIGRDVDSWFPYARTVCAGQVKEVTG